MRLFKNKENFRDCEIFHRHTTRNTNFSFPIHRLTLMQKSSNYMAILSNHTKILNSIAQFKENVLNKKPPH